MRAGANSPRRIGRRTAAARAIVFALLGEIRTGTLVLWEGDRRQVFGRDEPVANVTVRSAAAYPRLLRASRGMADAYVAGEWDSPDLVSLIRIAALNAGRLDGVRRWLAPLRAPVARLQGWATPRTRGRAAADVAAHYDLGNELFSLMLDPTMMYSCARFECPGMTLEEGQLAKLDNICDKLELSSGDHVLEIGTGWGGFALHAAATRGCRVTTVTLSAEQHAYTVQRLRRAGLEDRVTVLLRDYRDLGGRFDKLVSIEMIEAVGWRSWGTFFSRCASLLKPHGAMLLQAITIDDRLYEAEKATRSFIKELVFPGGALPSLEVMSRNLARRTNLQVRHLEDLTPFYVETLRRWREAFERQTTALEELGYDERFRRLWRLYLAYCEAGFTERRIADVQLLLAGPHSRLGRRGASPVAGSLRSGVPGLAEQPVLQGLSG